MEDDKITLELSAYEASNLHWLLTIAYASSNLHTGDWNSDVLHHLERSIFKYETKSQNNIPAPIMGTRTPYLTGKTVELCSNKTW